MIIVTHLPYSYILQDLCGTEGRSVVSHRSVTTMNPVRLNCPSVRPFLSHLPLHASQGDFAVAIALTGAHFTLGHNIYPNHTIGVGRPVQIRSP